MSCSALSSNRNLQRAEYSYRLFHRFVTLCLETFSTYSSWRMCSISKLPPRVRQIYDLITENSWLFFVLLLYSACEIFNDFHVAKFEDVSVNNFQSLEVRLAPVQKVTLLKLKVLYLRLKNLYNAQTVVYSANGSLDCF